MRNESLPEPLSKTKSRLLSLPRALKKVVMVATDIIAVGVCLQLTGLVAGFSLWSLPTIGFSPLVIFVVTASVVVGSAQLLGLYRSVVRFIGSPLYVACAKASAFATAVLWVITQIPDAFPNLAQVVPAFAAFVLIALSSSRFLARQYLNRRQSVTRERVLIYGAGSAGVKLAEALSAGSEYSPVAFVDDSRQLWGGYVVGLQVYRPAMINKLVADFGVKQVLLALPSVGRKRKRKILERISELPVHVQTMPEIDDIVSGKSRVDDIRDVDVEDLLGRESVPPDPKLLDACVRDKCVVVTGAGGSIGSELCRQIIGLGPRELILFEVSEVALYEIDRQLRERAALDELEVQIIPLLGSVHHFDRVRQIMSEYGVQTVYHAAAYKHVPMVENNLIEGVHNNVFGTLNTAKAAVETGVETFVLVSTDKAVSPTNVMGATKRFSELVLQALNHRKSETRFCMVRFGNVLASSGSVVPLFKEQIRNGGPVTVTHPEIIRYFMTIPEAAQLVIQAGSMAAGGDVFVLDMGKPVKIVDLARRMINLMGLSVRDDENPDGDIEILFTGLRPAEKLYEELLIGTDVAGTEHPRILRANESYLEPDELNPLIDELWAMCRGLDTLGARSILLRGVAEYEPSNDIEDLVWVRRQARERAANVTTLATYRDPS